MIIRHLTARGTEVIGLGVPNTNASADWDLGPTWCYLITGPRTTLIDTGRIGTFDSLRSLLKAAGKELSDIHRVIITHNHEDHDGNLVPMLAATKVEVWAHALYRNMISYYPDIEDGAPHPELPGSCRQCYMPEKFYRNCLSYHRERSQVNVDFAIADSRVPPDDTLSFVFTPGHTADSICVVLEGEVIFTGDTILPDITPRPSRASASQANRRILPEEYRPRHTVYGLMAYIKSLHRIIHLDSRLTATFPAHRLFYGGQFNIVHSPSERAREIIRFHIDRCRAILEIVSSQPATVAEIAERHFPPRLLRGSGGTLARNEIICHLEVMEECGDVRYTGEGGDLAQSTGSGNCLSLIGSYLGDSPKA